jgi:hypothetical protein
VEVPPPAVQPSTYLVQLRERAHQRSKR